MKKCISCGFFADETMTFCPACGSKLHEEACLETKDTALDNKRPSKLIGAEQLYQIGAVEESVKAYIEYIDDNPLDWETQIKIADICEELIKKHGNEKYRLEQIDRSYGSYSFLDDENGPYECFVAIRERMLKLALINAPESEKLLINKRLYGVVITPEFGVKTKAEYTRLKSKKGENQQTQEPKHTISPVIFWILTISAVIGIIIYLLFTLGLL